MLHRWHRPRCLSSTWHLISHRNLATNGHERHFRPLCPDCPVMDFSSIISWKERFLRRSWTTFFFFFSSLLLAAEGSKRKQILKTETRHLRRSFRNSDEWFVTDCGRTKRGKWGRGDKKSRFFRWRRKPKRKPAKIQISPQKWEGFFLEKFSPVPRHLVWSEELDDKRN